MSSSTVHYQHQSNDFPPSYSEACNQQGTVGGKPIYVRGPASPPQPLPTYSVAPTHYPHPQQAHVIITQPQGHYVVPVTEVPMRRGTCPSCRVGVLVQSHTCLGIMCCILFFPIGIFCCMVMTEKRCTYCHLRYD